VEGVYSMDGDLFPLERLVPLAREHGAWIYLDDAHGTGVLGPTGAGSAEHWGLTGAIDVSMGTLGKALGTAGAFVAGAETLRDFLLNCLRLPRPDARGRAGGPSCQIHRFIILGR